jgi:hypothetical protein
MDFLRRLVPPRPIDATRAVAVMPSRFASESPLRQTIGHADPVQRLDDNGRPRALDETSAPMQSDAPAVRRHPITPVQTVLHSPRPPDSGPSRRDDGTDRTSTAAPTDAPDVEVASPGALPDQPGGDRRGARAASPEFQRLAAARAVSRALHDVAATRARPRVELPVSRAIPAVTPAASPGLHGVAAPPPLPIVSPLSQSILAQRTLQSRHDNQVVHVTIGRIDVVASTAPAPATRRNPTPQQASVTLADYLRGSHGSRR